jgi:hypothetical protein
MRAIVEAGGTIVHEWPIQHVLEVGDRATGGTELADLYNRMKAAAVATDLDDLWHRLGIQVIKDAVTFNDQAPLAKIRKAITAPRKPSA